MEVRITGVAELQKALKDATGEIGRAARNATADTARAMQKDFRATLPNKFAITRRTFIDRQVKITKFPTKTDWSAVIAIEGPGGKPSTLAKFEDRGLKSPYTGGRLAIPAKGIRTKGGHVERKNAFKSFLPLQTLGGQYTKLRRSKGKFVAKKSLTSGVRTVGKKGSFLVRLKKSGLEALVRRQKGSRSIDLLYVLAPDTTIPRSLRFEADATASAEKHFGPNVADAIEHALRRAALK